MNIGVDARLLSTPLRGTARYIDNLLKYLSKIDKDNKYFIFQYEDLPSDNVLYNYVPIKKSKLPRQVYEHYWLNFRLPGLISELNIEIFFSPYIFVPFRRGNWKNVIAIHDVLTKVCKEYYTFHYRKYIDILVPLSIKRSDRIITISNSAMLDIIKYYKIPANKISYVHHWADDIFRTITISEKDKLEFLNKYKIPEKYILFVSVLEERKNLWGILKVSDILESKGIDIKFVLVGKEGFGYIKIKPEIEKRKKRIIVLQNVESDSDLVILYNLAKIFFFPTFYEGFGFPPLEAMKCGVPVITSNNSSLPEVIGEGGVMGNADDYEFFANSIIKLLNNQTYYNEMKEKAIHHAKKFTPEDHINGLINIFSSMS